MTLSLKIFLVLGLSFLSLPYFTGSCVCFVFLTSQGVMLVFALFVLVAARTFLI
jgi:hypothetical protein